MTPIIEGIGDDVMLFVILSLVVLFWVGVYFALTAFFGDTFDEIDGTVIVENNAPTAHNSGVCPICWNEPSLALQTNCGHLYCGECLLNVYRVTPNMNCPMCRAQVRILFVKFSNDERADPPRGGTLVSERTRINTFARLYNRLNSEPLRWLDRILDMPVLLQHFYFEAINGRFSNRYLRVRVFPMSILCFAYFFLPTDLIPVHIFGLVGFIDDLILAFIFAAYIANLYRRHLSMDGELIFGEDEFVDGDDRFQFNNDDM